MNAFLKWILLLPFAAIIQPLFIWTFLMIPLFIFQLISGWNIFFYFLIGGIILGLYYTVLSFGIFLYQSIVTKYRPDYWVTAISLCLSCLIFISSYFYKISQLFLVYKNEFSTVNGIIFLIFIIPSYLGIAYSFLVMPFFRKGLSED